MRPGRAGLESCHYEAGEERDFVTGYLKPACERPVWETAKFSSRDHNKERVVDRSLETLCNDRSRAAFDGVRRLTGIPVIILVRWMHFIIYSLKK